MNFFTFEPPLELWGIFPEIVKESAHECQITGIEIIREVLRKLRYICQMIFKMLPIGLIGYFS